MAMRRAAALWESLRSRLGGRWEHGPAAVPSQEPTVDEIVARHLAALGGADRLRSLRSVRMTGRLTGGELNRALMTVSKKRPARYCRRLEAGGDVSIQAVDGELVWGWGEKIDLPRPEPFKSRPARRFRRASDLEGPLLDFQAKGHKLAYAGRENVGATAVHRLDIIWKDGDRGAVLIDAATFLLAKIVEPAFDPQGYLRRSETTYGDYRQVGGIQWPFSELFAVPHTGLRHAILWDSVEVDSELDDALFKMPQPPTTAMPAAH
jgi:hypothetical protein